MRTCTKCGECKPLSMFYTYLHKGERKPRPECRACKQDMNKREWAEVWPRPLLEALADMNFTKWRYPVEPGALRGRV